MPVTLKQIEDHMEQMESTSALLAGCRNTIHHLAHIGKKNTQRAIDAEARVAELKKEVANLKAIMRGDGGTKPVNLEADDE